MLSNNASASSKLISSFLSLAKTDSLVSLLGEAIPRTAETSSNIFLTVG